MAPAEKEKCGQAIHLLELNTANVPQTLAIRQPKTNPWSFTADWALLAAADHFTSQRKQKAKFLFIVTAVLCCRFMLTQPVIFFSVASVLQALSCILHILNTVPDIVPGCLLIIPRTSAVRKVSSQRLPVLTYWGDVLHPSRAEILQRNYFLLSPQFRTLYCLTA